MSLNFSFKLKKIKEMDSPGIEPGAFCMQNRRDTTTLQTLFIFLNTNNFYRETLLNFEYIELINSSITFYLNFIF